MVSQPRPRKREVNQSTYLFVELTCELSNNRIKEIKLSYQLFADVLHLLYLKYYYSLDRIKMKMFQYELDPSYNRVILKQGL